LCSKSFVKTIASKEEKSITRPEEEVEGEGGEYQEEEREEEESMERGWPGERIGKKDTRTKYLLSIFLRALSWELEMPEK